MTKQMTPLEWEARVNDPEQESAMVAALHSAGCRCVKPLLGYIDGKGPRCRVCNTQVYEEHP